MSAPDAPRRRILRLLLLARAAAPVAEALVTSLPRAGAVAPGQGIPTAAPLTSSSPAPAHARQGRQRACPRLFDRCWNEAGWWDSSPICETGKAACGEILCSYHYLDQECGSVVASNDHCNGVRRMCQLEDQLHLARARGDGAEGRELFFVHIPKNAGTTVEQAGSEAGISWGKFHAGLYGLHLMPDGNTCNRWHVPPRMTGMPSPYQNTETFCITRHPYSRAVSEYKYLLSVPWGTRDAKRFNAPLDTFPECSVKGLNDFIQHAMRQIREDKRYIFDCHFVPQVEYIWDADGTQTCENIVNISSLPNAFDELMDRKANPARLPETKHNVHADACDDLSEDSLTSVSKAMLNEIFKEDFKKLNYTETGVTHVSNIWKSGAWRVAAASRLRLILGAGALATLLL